MLSALVGLLVLYGLVHIVAILHRKRGELQQLMKGPNKLILTYQDVSFTDQGPWLYSLSDVWFVMKKRREQATFFVREQ